MESNAGSICPCKMYGEFYGKERKGKMGIDSARNTSVNNARKNRHESSMRDESLRLESRSRESRAVHSAARPLPSRVLTRARDEPARAGSVPSVPSASPTLQGRYTPPLLAVAAAALALPLSFPAALSLQAHNFFLAGVAFIFIPPSNSSYKTPYFNYSPIYSPHSSPSTNKS